MIHAERERLADTLAGLHAEEWHASTHCGEWSVEQSTAHHTAAANTSAMTWNRSIVAARFDPDLHNAQRLSEHLRNTPEETLDRFRAVISSTTTRLGSAR